MIKTYKISKGSNNYCSHCIKNCVDRPNVQTSTLDLAQGLMSLPILGSVNSVNDAHFHAMCFSCDT